MAAKNNVSVGGYQGAGFAAMWSCFLACLLAVQGAKAAFSKTGVSPLFVGFLIGLSAMLAQLFFVLMCLFFALGAEANKNGWGTQFYSLMNLYASTKIHTFIETGYADNALGSFSLFNLIVYSLWAIVLSYKRSSLMDDSQMVNFAYLD